MLDVVDRVVCVFVYMCVVGFIRFGRGEFRL